MKIYDQLYVGGTWVDLVGRGTIGVTCASTEAVVTSIPTALWMMRCGRSRRLWGVSQ